MSDAAEIEPPAIAVSHVGVDAAWAWVDRRTPFNRLVWAPSGVVAVEAAQRTWLLPTTLGLWIPSELPHTIDAHAAGVYVLALPIHACPITWTDCTAVSVTGFVRETILRLADRSVVSAARRRTETVLCDALRPLPDVRFDLPIPRDGRVRLITAALLHDPSDGRTMADWGHEVGASVRTLTRLFTTETGTTFGQWRLQARMRQAMAALSQGDSVGRVARAVGYSRTSSFDVAFRRCTGQTPSALAARVQQDGHDQG